jgi:hypothetical protein
MLNQQTKEIIHLIAREVASLIDTQPPESRRWMRLKEAARYASIGEKRLIKLASDEGGRKIVGCKDSDSGLNEWIFDRHSIDAYRQSQMQIDRAEVDKRAVDILRSMGAI